MLKDIEFPDPENPKFYNQTEFNLALYIEAFRKWRNAMNDILSEFHFKLDAMCKAGPPSDYQNLWRTCQLYLLKIKRMMKTKR